MNEIATWSATRLCHALRNGALSPIEIAETCLERVAEHNDALNAVVTLNERLLDEDRKLAARNRCVGILYGLPVGIKDTTPVAGMRTTLGSLRDKDFVPTGDALVVRRLR